MIIQETFKKRIIARFMGKGEMEKFQNTYNEFKRPTVNNLKENAARNDVIRQIVKEEISKKRKKRFWEFLEMKL